MRSHKSKRRKRRQTIKRFAGGETDAERMADLEDKIRMLSLPTSSISLENSRKHLRNKLIDDLTMKKNSLAVAITEDKYGPLLKALLKKYIPILINAVKEKQMNTVKILLLKLIHNPLIKFRNSMGSDTELEYMVNDLIQMIESPEYSEKKLFMIKKLRELAFLLFPNMSLQIVRENHSKNEQH